MHDNPQTAPGLDFQLSSHCVVSLTGRDATAFAQAQFMNDVGGLAPGHWQWSGWLTPKGRVIVLFALLKTDEETLRIVLFDGDADAFVAALRRFVFRSKVAIEVAAEWRVTGAFEAPRSGSGNVLGVEGDGTVELDMGTPGLARILRVSVHGAALTDPAAEARWACADLEHGLPRLAPSQREQWTPQQLSLERLNAFSIRKGCYPGQEIIARTHFLGKAKRGLALIESTAPLVVEAQVHDGDRALGAIVGVSSAAGRHLGLAVLPLGEARGELTVDGTSVRELPLREGLSR